MTGRRTAKGAKNAKGAFLGGFGVLAVSGEEFRSRDIHDESIAEVLHAQS